jgi:predicted CXXCH cytochrome family protein
VTKTAGRKARGFHVPLLAWHLALVGLALGVASTGLAQSGSRVSQTRHNLTASGPGPIRVAGTSEVCIFCHTPHAANPIGPLWNRDDPGHYYEVYRSSTLVATVGQPTGDSRLCLSCHDGTIALTQLHNPRTAPASTIYITPQDTGYIGTDLTSHHPISFVYDSALAAKNPQLRDPATLPSTLPLDRQRQLQCTTCHDAHDDSLGFFLRMDNRESAMCVRCHDMTGWTLSAHAASTASILPIKVGRWDRLRVSTVRDLGCESCHRPHSAGGRERLLRYAAEEDNCLACHNGSVAKDVASALVKVSTHPVRRTTGVHEPNENPLAMAAHVECADCHNPHATQIGPASKAPMVKAVMRGATGVNSFGRTAGEARFEYEVCYKCHASRNPARAVVNRVIPQNDIAQAFSQSNASFHPIEVQGRNMDVPSLLQPMLTSTQIYCTDCHNSDTSVRGGARGPHGSAYAPLLARNYTTTDNTPESTQAYDLCYSCHNRTSILGNQTFSKHSLHIVDQRTPCSVCHDSHGVLQNARLINFDRFVVKPTKSGLGPTYISSGLRKGSCTLSCHGKEHNAQKYP